MDGRWRGIGGYDGDDLLQFTVSAGCQSGVSDPEIGFSMAAEFWMSSGKLVEPPCVFRSRALSSPEGSAWGWPRRRPHVAARPWAHRAATWCARLVAPLRLVFWLRGSSVKIGPLQLFPGIFLKVDFLHKNKTPGQFC
jgi:hypothetical protein